MLKPTYTLHIKEPLDILSAIILLSMKTCQFYYYFLIIIYSILCSLQEFWNFGWHEGGMFDVPAGIFIFYNYPIKLH